MEDTFFTEEAVFIYHTCANVYILHGGGERVLSSCHLPTRGQLSVAKDPKSLNSYKISTQI